MNRKAIGPQRILNPFIAKAKKAQIDEQKKKEEEKLKKLPFRKGEEKEAQRKSRKEVRY